jgi:hypothetical protein
MAFPSATRGTIGGRLHQPPRRSIGEQWCRDYGNPTAYREHVADLLWRLEKGDPV